MTTILLAILALMSGFAAYQLRKPPQLKMEEPFFYSINQDSINRAEIAFNGHTVAFVWNASKNEWQFDDGDHTPVFTDRWGGIILLLSGPRVDRVLLDQVDNKAQYGLEHPTATIELTLDDGSRLTALLGNRTPGEASYYAMRDGSSQLVLVNRSWGDVLIKLVSEPPYVPTPSPPA